MRVTIIAITMALAASGVAFAQTDPAEPTAPTVQEQTAPAPEEQSSGRPDPDEEVICRWVNSSVETRLRRQRTRLCATRTQWEIMEEENRRQIVNRGSLQGRRE